MMRVARAYACGDAAAPALVLAAPLSFWGGVDVETGRVIDRSHPDLGKSVSAVILVMPGARGSSSSSSVLAECLRRGTGPAAIVLETADPILTVGAIVARTLYDLRCPIVVCPIDEIASGDRLIVTAPESGVAHLTRV